MTPTESGYRPQHRVLPDYLTSGTHDYLGLPALSPGASAIGTITFITPEVYPYSIDVGDLIQISEGDRIVGHARILRVLNPLLQRGGVVSGEQVSFGFLADHLDAIARVSEWLVTEWGTDKSSVAIDEFASSLRSRTNRNRIPLQLVALIEQRVVGTATVKKHELRVVHPELTNWLGSVFVDPQFRGLGIASGLTEKAVQVSRELGVRLLHLQTEDLTGGLYRKIGWKPSHTIEYEGSRRLIMVNELAATPT